MDLNQSITRVPEQALVATAVSDRVLCKQKLEVLLFWPPCLPDIPNYIYCGIVFFYCIVSCSLGCGFRSRHSWISLWFLFASSSVRKGFIVFGSSKTEEAVRISLACVIQPEILGLRLDVSRSCVVYRYNTIGISNQPTNQCKKLVLFYPTL